MPHQLGRLLVRIKSLRRTLMRPGVADLCGARAAGRATAT